jgi:flagellar biogenesis protein FliO
MAGALVVVVCLIPLSVFLLKRFQQQVKPIVSSKEDIDIVTVKNMGSNQKIAVVKIGTRVLALGMTQHSIRTLADLSPGEYPPADEERPADQFSKSVDQFLNRFKKEGGENKKFKIEPKMNSEEARNV